MSIVIIKRPRPSLLVVATVSSVFAILLLTSPAQALGDNRIVKRSCGENAVSSGYIPERKVSWAETRHHSGDCPGRLSVALESEDGQRTERKYADKNDEKRVRVEMRGHARYGLHWGCDDCNVTKS